MVLTYLNITRTLSLLLLCCEALQLVVSSGNSESDIDSTKTIVDFLQQQDDQLEKIEIRPMSVLLFGNTGCGKSTLASLLTDAELESVETFPGSAQYVIVDRNDRISRPNETITSKTLIPELLVDVSTNTSYYDCPGFEDTRSVKHDIAVTYSLKRLLDFSRAVKLLFLTTYTSVKAAGDRDDFVKLAGHAITLIKNIDKFRDGIALVVTKVENRMRMVNGVPGLVDDETEISAIAHFLAQTKTELEAKRGAGDTPVAEQHSIDEKIKFIEILLTKDENQYKRISIIRLASEPGPVSTMPVLQGERKRTSAMIKDNLHYVSKENIDFGFTIADKSAVRVLELMDEMKSRLNAVATGMDDEIKQFYVQLENQNADIKVTYDKIYSAYQRLQFEKSTVPQAFIKQASEAMAALNIGTRGIHMERFSNELKLIDFLQEVSARNVSIEITNGLGKSTNYIDESRRWYGFLNSLHPIVSTYRLREEAKIVLQKLAISEGDKEIGFVNEDLKQLVSHAESQIYDDVENTKVNPHKLNALKRLLQQMLDENLIISCDAGKLLAKGYNVKISDVVKAECWPSAKTIDIFALDTVYIDMDIDKTGAGVQLSIIASTWEIVNEKQIILNGEDGKPHPVAQAPNSVNIRESGKIGEPGLPGGSSGHFLGIGRYFSNGPHLKINANGGTGGPGQTGGNGT